jgi:hypothetical protein
MIRTRLSGFMMVAILAFSAMVMIGCSGTRDISKEDETEVYSSKDANGHKGTQEFVSTSSLTEKASNRQRESRSNFKQSRRFHF